MQSFNPYANTHNLVIVAPDGLHDSFNGLDCCGYALGSKIDDIGFFSQIQATLEEDYQFVKSIYSYAVGWSNGGFMVMYSSQLFRAISPISGYIIDYSKMIGGTSVFFHHSLNDPFVRSTGCCNDPKVCSDYNNVKHTYRLYNIISFFQMPTCCCGIFAERCVSVQDVMKDIAQKKNGCNYEAGVVQLEQSFEDTQKGISCLTSVGKSCIANNTICMYNHSGHFNGGSFATSFPMSEQVMDFFANEACAVNNGLWDNKNKACTCQDELVGGVFCLDSAGSDVIKTLDSDEEDTLLPEKRSSIEEPNHMFTGGILILTVAVFVWFRHQINRRQKEKIDNNTSGEKIELVSSGLMRFGDI